MPPTVPSDAAEAGCPALTTILDSMDALIYVADMQTYEMLFLNAYGRKKWGNKTNGKCWQVLQLGQTGPCSFCTNAQLLDAEGRPTAAKVWEVQNTADERWYQCRDQAIRWVDGRLVRLEIATDITDRKAIEEQLGEARQQAERLADTDPLTSLNNRRAFFKRGHLLLSQSKHVAEPVSLITFDLDFFKRINDQYGHAAGDELLKTVAQTTLAQTRASDVLARIGGEEFALLMPQTNLSQALALAERLRDAIASSEIRVDNEAVSCTASLGVAAFDGKEETLDALMAEADRALYAAKRGGRNQTQASGQEGRK